MKSFLSFSLFFLIIASCSSLIEGKIEDFPKKGLTGGLLNITRLDSGDRFSKVVEISEEGEFSSEGFGEGEYLLEAVIPGYRVSSSKWDTKKNKPITLKIGSKINTLTKSFGKRKNLILDRGQGKVTLNPPTY